MKRRKKLWIMGAVLLSVLVLTVSVSLMEHHLEQVRASGETILQIDPQSVTALSWDHDGEILSFTRDDRWHYDADPAFPVSAEEMEQMLAPFNGLAAAFRIEDVEDYGQYGLTEPVCTIRLTADGQPYEVKLGAFSQMDSQRYVDIGDGNVYLVLEDPMAEYGSGLGRVIEHDRVPEFENVERITADSGVTILRQPEGAVSYREEDVYFARQDDGFLPLDTAAVDRYLDSLIHLNLTDYRTYTASSDDLSVYGLDQPELTIQVDYTADETPAAWTLHLARDPEALAEAESESDQTVPVYARVGDSELVYELMPQDYDRLSACTANDLRHREIFPAKLQDVRALRISLDGSDAFFEQQEKETEDVFVYEGQETDLSGLLTDLSELKAETFTDEIPDGVLEIALEATVGESDIVTVELYRLDGQSCVAVVDGVSVAKVPRSQVVDLMEAVRTIVLSPAEPTDASES